MVERFSLNTLGLWLLLTFLAFVPLKSRAESVKVVVTTSIIRDAVEQIGANLVAVTSLMGPGVDPHLYQATHGDLIKLRQAQIIFHNGLHLEGKLSDALSNLAKTKTCIAVSDYLSKEALLVNSAALNQPDPHIWFDVKQWADALQAIVAGLTKVDPLNQAHYQKNYDELKAQLYKLHEQVKVDIARIPKAQRVLLTAHDAFGYFGRAYEIEVMALQGISTASDFGLFDLKALVDTVLARKIKAAFVESSVSPKFVQALIEGARARGHAIKLGGELYSDALGESGSPGATYSGMVRHNVHLIVEALQ